MGSTYRICIFFGDFYSVQLLYTLIIQMFKLLTIDCYYIMGGINEAMFSPMTCVMYMTTII